MNKGKDSQGKEVLAKDAETGKEYFCCFCNKRLIKKHSKYIWFFSHKAHESCIKYDLDNSEWASTQRNNFEPQEIEFAFDYEKQKNLVDVNLKNYLALMYCNSFLHKETFDHKTNCCLSYFKKLMWVLNFQNLLEDGKIYDCNHYLKWNNASKMFENYQFDDNVIIAAQIKDDSSDATIKSFVIFDNPKTLFEDKEIIIRRRLTREEFIRYYNDIANKKDPEEIYNELDKKEREKIQYEAELLEKERENKNLEYKQHKEELEKKKVIAISDLLKNQKLKINNKIEKTKAEEKQQAVHTIIDLWNLNNINKTMRFKNVITNEEWVIKDNPRRYFEKYNGRIYAINCATSKSELVLKSNEKIWIFESGF